MKTEQVKKLLKPILSEAHPRLHDQNKKGFYALRAWALANPIIKEVEITQFVKVPEVVKEIHHVDVVEKVVEKVVLDPDQSKQIERLQKKNDKLENDMKNVTRKCETAAAIALLRFEISKHRLTPNAFDAWLDDLALLSLADCICIAYTCMCILGRSSDADIKVTLNVSRYELRKAISAWIRAYCPNSLPQSDRDFLDIVIQKRRPKKENEPRHNSWLGRWVTLASF